MKILYTFLFCTLASSSIFIHSAPEAQRPLMSEYEQLHYKYTLGQRLQSSLLNEFRFKAVYQEYRSFCGGNHDPIIEHNLQAAFKKDMAACLREHTIHAENMNTWNALIKERKLLKDMDREDVLVGFGLWAATVGLGAISLWSLRSVVNLDRPASVGDGILPAYSILGTLFAALTGTQKIGAGWNHTHDLKQNLDATAQAIAMLNMNYAYAYPHEKLLSMQIVANE